MQSREISGDWAKMKTDVRTFWPQLTEDDVVAVAGERDELMRKLKARYAKSYGEIEREVTEFELRDARSAFASRPSMGITND